MDFPIVAEGLHRSFGDVKAVETMSGLYRTVAELNPITYVIDASRHQVLIGFDLGQALTGFAVALLFATATLVLALSQLRRRLADMA